MTIQRVLHVVGAMNRGGTEVMLMNLYRQLDRSKWQFDFLVYTKEPGDFDEEIRSLGGRIIRLEHPTSITKHIRVMKGFGPYAAVHAHTLYQSGVAVLAARRTGVPVRIVHAHTTADPAGSMVKKAYQQMMRQLITRYATHRFACSQEAGTFLFGPSSFDVIPNAIDTAAFLHTNRERGEYPVAGHAGRFIPAKNHAFLLNTAVELKKTHPDMRWLLVGDGDLLEETKEQAVFLKVADSMTFAGKRQDMAGMMQAMDVFVFPSLHEGLGLVLLEAQASGMPCIVSEAIQPEADLELGLVHRVPLSLGAKAWAEQIMAALALPVPSASEIEARFNERGYTISAVLARWLTAYGMKGGEEDETIAYRIL